MALWCILTIPVILGSFANATPTVPFPLNSQVPPVVRINEPFSFTFSSSTFSSSLPLTYTLSSAPNWLSLDSNTRTLSGTPSSSDVGQETITGVVLELTASDTSGSITSNVTIVISRNPAPIIAMPLSSQISAFGTGYEAPSTLLYHPSTPFNFSFNHGTFSEATGTPSLGYYAVSSDNAPLPSWILFDENSLSFSGETPDYESLIEPPQTFGIMLIASDVDGFSGTSISFAIEVGIHLLAFKNEYMVMNATTGSNEFDGISNGLQLDGQQMTASDLTTVVIEDLPSWLQFDNSTLALSGTPPKDAISSNITVHATDKYGDTANSTIYIDVSTSVFSGAIGLLNATIGSSFSYDLSTYLHNPQDISMTIELPPTVTWVSLNSQSFLLSGKVPSNLHPSKYDIVINATSKSSQLSNSQPLILSLISGSTGSPTTSSGPSVGTSDNTAASSSKNLSGGVIAAIVVPVVLVASLLIVWFAIWWYRHVATEDEENQSESDMSDTPRGGSSVVEILKPTPVAKPEPLLLDTSGFGRESASSIYTTNFNTRGSRSNMDDGIRRSRTVSVISSTPLSDRRRSESMGNSAQAYTDNTLAKIDSRWQSTQKSTTPTIDSMVTSPQRLSRNYSNYSRKGHTRRSGRVWSSGALRDIDVSTGGPTILDSRENNLSPTPMDNHSRISTSIPVIPEGKPPLEKPKAAKTAQRNSTFISPTQRVRSIGHGVLESVSSPAGVPKRRSIGHGQDWNSELVRDTRIWQTRNSGDTERNRCSYASNTTDYTEIWSRRNSAIVSGMTVYPAPKHAALARLSQSSVNSRPRPISRRIVGQSPFLSGRPSPRASRSSPTRIRTSFADSPTVPEEEIKSTLSKPIPCEDPPKSPALIYGSPREGTKQLHSYIQTRLQRTKTRESVKSFESRDSRFESAYPSMQSLHQVYDNQENQAEEEGYESDGSWETDTHLEDRDESPNIVTYDPPSPRNFKQESPKALKSHPVLKSPMVGLGKHARMVSGRGKRPVSVDAKEGKGSVRAKVERVESGGSFRAYI